MANNFVDEKVFEEHFEEMVTNETISAHIAGMLNTSSDIVTSTCVGTKWFYCSTFTEIAGDEVFCHSCISLWEYLKNEFPKYTTLDVVSRQALVKKVRETKWRVTSEHGLNNIVRHPEDMKYISNHAAARNVCSMCFEPGKIASRETKNCISCEGKAFPRTRHSNTRSPKNLRSFRGQYIFRKRCRFGPQINLFLGYRSSWPQIKLPKNYMKKVLSSVKTVLSNPKSFAAARKILGSDATFKLKLQECYASVGALSLPLSAMTSSCPTPSNVKPYATYRRLPGDIQKTHYKGDKTIVAMSSPLHFLGTPEHLVTMIQDLKKRGIPIRSVFFLFIGLKENNRRLVPRVTAVSFHELLETILNDPPLLLIYDKPAIGMLYILKKGLEARDDCLEPGRSIFNTVKVPSITANQ